MTEPQWITPDWPAPPNVRAAASLRTGGISTGPFASLNLAAHVGDDSEAVRENRRRLRAALNLPSEPTWLNQVHGSEVVEAVLQPASEPLTADAAYATTPGAVCAVMTADCLPVLFCNREGTRVAAAHAGWRGLAGGVLTATVVALDVPADRLIAWLGPAIEQDAFEVGSEVREQFLARDTEHMRSFAINAAGRWQADLYALARRELANLGIRDIYGGGYRCYADASRFFSYRRDQRTGRMATMVWLQRPAG
ncbi:MAG TPA: peptidoglycan editing factor PgeF [Steroidobacteraceae bacterium]|jgi:hypothetical protein